MPRLPVLGYRLLCAFSAFSCSRVKRIFKQDSFGKDSTKPEPLLSLEIDKQIFLRRCPVFSLTSPTSPSSWTAVFAILCMIYEERLQQEKTMPLHSLLASSLAFLVRSLRRKMRENRAEWEKSGAGGVSELLVCIDSRREAAAAGVRGARGA